MKRVVFDTSVIVASLRSRTGASFALLQLVLGQSLKPVLTVPLFLEYEDVLKRPDQMQAHGLDANAIDRLLTRVAKLGDAVEVFYKWRPQGVDPADEFIIEAAINGRADAIVTFNIRHIELPAQRFGIMTLTPGEFLSRYQR